MTSSITTSKDDVDLLWDNWISLRSTKEHESCSLPEAVFNALDPYVRAAISRVIGSRDEVSDISQDVWLAVVMAPPRPSRTGIKAYVCGMAIKKALTWIQRKRRELHLDRVVCELKDPGSAPMEHLESEEERRRLLAALKELPQELGHVVLQKYGFDQTYEEISEAEGLEVSTIRSWVSRAKERLRVLLKDTSGDGRGN